MGAYTKPRKPSPTRGMKRHAEHTYRGYLYRGLFIKRDDMSGWYVTLPNGKMESWDEMSSIRYWIDRYFEENN